jgi:iron(III) transport system substrate-binding protein
VTVLITAVFLVNSSEAFGQGSKPAAAEIARYLGSDREQLLLAGGKKEGKVVWYTSLTGGPDKQVPAAFEVKYPGLKVETYRASSEDLMARIVAESQARRPVADAIESTLPMFKVMRDQKWLLPFTSPLLEKFPEDAKEPAENKLYLWASTRESYIGLAYNKSSVSGRVIPKSYEDLLHPGLKGKIGFTTTDTGVRVMAAMLKFKGEEFVRKLKTQDVALHAMSARALLDLVISGEISASPSIFRSHATVSMSKGAPVAWAPMDVVPTNSGAAGITAYSPHPHAALLFIDFLLSNEGQKILEKFALSSPFKDYGFKRWYPEKGLTAAEYEKESNRWEKILRDLGRK